MSAYDLDKAADIQARLVEGDARGICADCRYWADALQLRNRQLMPQGFGECRRRAPTGMTMSVTVAGDQKSAAVMYPFPPVPPTDWCGEFEAKALQDGRDG